MRLIDADALKEKIDNIWDGRPISLLGARILATIDHAPTIDPKAKVIAQVTFDEDKLREIVHEEVERIKEEYDIVDEWIPCSERLPKEDEFVGNVCKYYLIQDEYGDMHVAHLSSRGWETIESVKALGCDVVAWMPLPEPYKGGEDE